MSKHHQAIGRERWPLLEAINMIEMLSYLGTSPLAEKRVTDEIEWVITGVWDNTFNGVARAQLSEAHADQVIDEVTGRFRERDIPHLWFLNVDSRPANLEQLLLAHGWVRLRQGVGMAIDLSAITSPFPPPPNLSVERVVDEHDFFLFLTSLHLREPQVLCEKVYQPCPILWLAQRLVFLQPTSANMCTPGLEQVCSGDGQ